MNNIANEVLRNDKTPTVIPQDGAHVIPLRDKPDELVSNVPAIFKKASNLTFFKPKAILKRMTVFSFIACVLIPTILGSLYYILIASDRYAASAGFSVRTLEGSAVPGDLLGSLSGAAASSGTTTDSYIIMEFLTSRSVVEHLLKEGDFLNAYSNEKIDFWYRLDPELPIEDIVDYWSWMINPTYNTSSGLINFEVEAFTPEDALKVANLIVKFSQELVNDLSEQARKDAVAFAQKEVATQELRLKLIRNNLRNYRAQTKALDPSAEAAAQIELTTALEQQIITLKARLNAALSSNLNENSPTVRDLKRQISSLESELEQKQAQIVSNGGSTSLSEILADFERLEIEQEFAQTAYTTAMASLEKSRIEADRQQRFLAVYQRPSLPQDAIYPERLINSFLIFVVCGILWSIGLLLVNSVRDHLR